MVRRGITIIWYAALLGLLVMLFEMVTGGITGGLKTGLKRNVGLAK